MHQNWAFRAWRIGHRHRRWWRQSRRYGVSSTRGRDCGGLTDCGVGRGPLLAYVAGNVHRWDLRRPGLSRTRLILEVPHGRRADLYFSRPCPARFHRCRATRARRVPGRLSRADPRGIHPGSAPVHWLVPGPVPAAVLGPAARTSRLSPANWKPRAGPVLPSPAGCPPSPGSTSTPSRKNSLTTRPPAAAGLRVARHRPRPQRGRRAAGRSRARAGTRARADLPARPQRAARVGGHRRGH